MNPYNVLMLPLEKLVLSRIRKEIISKAYGNVLEIGYGTGVNFRYYRLDTIERVSALDTKINLLNTKKLKFPVELYEGRAEELPFESESFDTVVETLVFCSIEDLTSALREIQRVLKPGGIFLFVDHVKPEKKRLAGLAESINWFWHDMAGGCNLLNESHKAIEASGLTIDRRGSSSNGIIRWGIGIKTK